jgi:UDP-2,3-diacylglucosamine hydrolase
MDTPTTIVVSDAHMGAVPEENEQAFFRFLERVPDLTRDLLINGDLFDFWFEYRHAILSQHFQLLHLLRRASEAGVRIRLVGGNHDAWGGRFLEDSVGMELIDGPARLDVGGRSALVAHGDGLAGGDFSYKVLKRALRSRWASSLFRILHPDLGAWIATVVSGTADRHANGVVDELNRAEHLSSYASDLLRSEPGLDLVVFGHVHQPELLEVEPGRYYLNSGDWIFHRSYAVVTPADIEIREWEATSPHHPG